MRMEEIKTLLDDLKGLKDRAAFTTVELTRMGLGCHTYLWQQVRDGHLVGTKRGRYTIFLRTHVEAWLAAMPTITPRPRRAATEKPAKRRRRARNVTSAAISL